MNIQASATFTHPGMYPAQEDAALTVAERGIFVLADGFGGPGCGDQAAKLACDSVKNFLVKEAGDQDATLPFILRSYFSLAGNVLFNALIHANRKLMGMNQGKGVHERGGASVIAGYLDGSLLALANVGACTAWIFRGGQAAELVSPRTYARLADPFVNSVAPTTHPNNLPNTPMMSLGTAPDLEPEIFEYRLRGGDWVAFMTDGVSSATRERILGVHRQGISSENSLSEVESIFKQEKCTDNASVSLLIF